MKKFTILLGLLALAGCTSIADKARENLKTGMTQDEVREIMGNPNRELDKSWYYVGKNDLILNFDDKGIYQSYETSEPTAAEKKQASSENEARVRQIRAEERERQMSNPDMFRNYQ